MCVMQFCWAQKLSRPDQKKELKYFHSREMSITSEKAYQATLWGPRKRHYRGTDEEETFFFPKRLGRR